MSTYGILQRFREYLPVSDQTPMLSLNEGNTPLVHLGHLSEKLNINLFGKIEGANPTGSFKDRGMVLAVAKAKEEGSRVIICASTGNTSASAAAYAARAGLECIVVIPDGKVAAGKVAQAAIHGAKIVAIKGNFDQAQEIVTNLKNYLPITPVNSTNPYRIEGQKTAAFEICEQLGKAPDILAIPVGNAGNITSYWKGFKEYNERNETGLPEMRGFQAEGCAAIVRNEVIENPETIATAIRIGNPASWSKAVAAAEESHGKIDSVTDEEILEAYKLLARTEGIFAEPGSAASLAGVIKQVKSGEIKPGSTIVAVLTGNGLKDPDIALTAAELTPTVLPSDEKEVAAFIKSFS
ncbi:threonine synthase [Bacillus sp. FJAT-27225]|uniref:threonine synthase n=1 Tax=Bacillus sp. FJAT-27225 TaxID=1743144 RepID=UPI00080C2FA4|nr:threonine synthase [Bacillus sp. FJAT-27225]OCA87731.1 threonine synthase [Bacillus sp. FJAT-27225]